MFLPLQDPKRSVYTDCCIMLFDLPMHSLHFRMQSLELLVDVMT